MLRTFSMGLGAFYERVDTKDNHAIMNFLKSKDHGLGIEMSLASSGHLNKILIEKKVLQRIGQRVELEDATFSETISRTFSGSAEYTELIIAYGADHYTHCKEVAIGSLWKLVNLSVTTILSWERIWAMKVRILGSLSS